MWSAARSLARSGALTRSRLAARSSIRALASSRCAHPAVLVSSSSPLSSLSPSNFTRYEFESRSQSIRSLATAAAGEKFEIMVPEFTESITEGTIAEWTVEIGQAVEEDQLIVQIETDKIVFDVRSDRSGVLVERFGAEGDIVTVGERLAVIDPSAEATVASSSSGAAAAAEDAASEAGSDDATPTPTTPAAAKKEAPVPDAPLSRVLNVGESGERRVGVSRMRKRIAERLKEAQNTAAMLTTFNEVDMSALIDLRSEYKDAFLEKHGAKLGFMSAFVKASTIALLKSPEVNAYIDGDDIVYRDYVDISVAVATPTGLVVPNIRGCENMNFADIEKTIISLGERAKKNKLSLQDMQGGTFTISNGGVFGSLLSTPIINMPQSAILGMHKIQKRPVVVGDEIVIRPMMYLALSYDHRLIDGREAVTFLRRIKTLIEDPRRLLLEIDL